MWPLTVKRTLKARSRWTAYLALEVLENSLAVGKREALERLATHYNIFLQPLEVLKKAVKVLEKPLVTRWTGKSLFRWKGNGHGERFPGRGRLFKISLRHYNWPIRYLSKKAA